MRKLSIAIVGAGLMGRWHAASAVRAGGTIAAVVDVEPAAAHSLAGRYRKSPCFSDLAGCLAECPVDVVHICTSPASHFTLAERGLRAGKHVLVEKPLAPDETRTGQLLELAKQAGVLLGCVQQYPFQRGFVRLRERFHLLGEPVRIGYRLCSAGGAGLTRDQRRELLFGTLPHPASLLHSLPGVGLPIDEWDVGQATADELTAHAMRGGLAIQIDLSLRGRPTRNELEVVGTRGTAVVDLFHGYAVWQPGAVSRLAKLLRPFSLGGRLLWSAGGNLARRACEREPAYPGLRGLIGDFYRRVQSGEDSLSSDRLLLETARFVEHIRSCAALKPEAQAKEAVDDEKPKLPPER